jgi:hypothetical protein
MRSTRSDAVRLPAPPPPGVIAAALQRIGGSSPRVRARDSPPKEGRSVPPPVIDSADYFAVAPPSSASINTARRAAMSGSETGSPDWLSLVPGPVNRDGVMFGGPCLGLILSRLDSERVLGPDSWSSAGFMGPIASPAASQDACVKARAARPTLRTPLGIYAYARGAAPFQAEVLRYHDPGDIACIELVIGVAAADLAVAASHYAALIGNPELELLARSDADANALLVSVWAPSAACLSAELPPHGTKLSVHLSLGARAPLGVR